ncbi:hypothetical protein ACQPXT_13235 [Streptomyces sp. CA-100214]
MARTKIALNTEPHVVEIGDDTELKFQPEIMGDEFIDAYSELREAQKSASGVDLDDLSNLDPSMIRGAARAMRAFLAKLMLPESAEFFLRVDVVQGGEILKSFTNWAEAEEYAEGIPGARAQWALQLPDRALVQIMEFVVGLYGGGMRSALLRRPPPLPSHRTGLGGVGWESRPPRGRPPRVDAEADARRCRGRDRLLGGGRQRPPTAAGQALRAAGRGTPPSYGRHPGRALPAAVCRRDDEGQGQRSHGTDGSAGRTAIGQARLVLQL